MSGSLLLARLDMSDEENVKTAQHELRRAGNDPAALAVWAGKWGEALTLRCSDAEGAITSKDDYTELEGDLRIQEDRSKDLASAIQDAARAIDQFLERETDALAAKHFEFISKVGDDLEAVL